MNRRRMASFLLAVAVFLLLTVLPSGAQTKRPSNEQLLHTSEVVVVGKVREKTSAWDAGRTRIETSVTLEVSDYIKGNGSGSLIIVVTPGGEVGGIGEMYSHTARFEEGEEVVVFAKRDGKNNLRVTGGPAGRQRISTDPATGRKSIADGVGLEDYVAALKKSAGGDR